MKDIHKCIGCNKIITRGYEMYVDELVDPTTLVRFFTHLECAQNDLSPTAAKRVLKYIDVEKMKKDIEGK